MKSRIKIQLAKEFRKKSTGPEKILWEALRNRKLLNLKFRRQHVINGYIVDFYCSKLKLVIEVDGPIHLKQLAEDKEKQEIIEKKYKVVRFNNEEVENNLQLVIEKIKKSISEILLLCQKIIN